MIRLFKKQVVSPPILATLLVCSFCLAVLGGCRKKTPASSRQATEPRKQESPGVTEKVVLRSVLSQMGWYTADANALREQIDGFFRAAQAEPIDNVIALILPHAGYRFSGETAANAIKTTAKQYKRIIVMGPSHNPYVGMEEVFSVPRVTHYETPLGQIPLDTEFIAKLLEHSMFQNIPRAHKYERGIQEHSVQIELPLLQTRQRDFKLVPIVAGRCSFETIAKAGDILRALVDSETLFVASSDFVHYGARFGYVPFTENVPEEIRKLDMGAYEYIARLDSKGFLEYTQRTGATICGRVPIAVLLSTLSKPVEAKLVKYTTSGELTGDYNNSVSYLAVAFSGPWQRRAGAEPKDDNPGLTEQDKQQLLALARRTIKYALQNKRVPEASELGVEITDAMKKPRAAFVTLKKNSQLRGCIGDIFPQRPLYKSVLRNAINASFNDSRFPQLSEAELDDVKIEISALTVPKPVESYSQIRIGTDGVVLNKDERSAVFLPQVAPEQGWDLNQTLTRLSLKADLPADAWKEGARFLVFQADVFGEQE
jgi:AmmeMemoRadiSam system protein B/AmmeMemoRadiSam system protein A